MQCKLVHRKYKEKYEVLYTFTLNEQTYLLNVESSYLMFLKPYNTEFDYISKTFTDQNSRPLEIEDKFNLTLLVVK